MDPITTKEQISPERVKDVGFLPLPVRFYSVCWGNKNLTIILSILCILTFSSLQSSAHIHNTWNNYKTSSTVTSSRSNLPIFAKHYMQINKIPLFFLGTRHTFYSENAVIKQEVAFLIPKWIPTTPSIMSYAIVLHNAAVCYYKLSLRGKTTAEGNMHCTLLHP